MIEQIKMLETEFRNNLKSSFADSEWNLFLSGLSIAQITESSITLAVSSPFIQHSIQDHYLGSIGSIFETILGKKYNINIEVIKNEAVAEEHKQVAATEIKATQPIIQNKPEPITGMNEISEKDVFSLKLNDKYTFDNFVIGENNNFAANAAIAVAKNPGTQYNPLLIYGGVGLGKTHLIQAIGNDIIQNDPNKKIIYINAEDFVNDFLAAILAQKNKSKSKLFKQKYRSADVLLIDDIHFFQGKQQTQEELFHTFNALYDSNKQIVFTCDRPVSELKDLEDRIRSRFTRGMNIDLQPPKYESRVGILLQNLEQKRKQIPNLNISMDVIDYIANNIVTNVRDLESAFTTLAGYSDLVGVDLTVDIAKEKLKDNISSATQANLTIDYIIKTVSDFYNVPLVDLKGKKRHHTIVSARQIGMYVARKLTDFSTTEIGNYFNKDHTTVMHSLSRIKNQLKTDPNLQPTIDRLIKTIQENHSNI